MTNTEPLHPQDARTKAILNRNIKLRQRDELRSRHSKVWSDRRFIADRESGTHTMGRHRARPLIEENPLVII